MSDEKYDSDDLAYPFAIEVLIDDGWKRMMIRYSTREVAKGWVSFVKKYWNASRSRVVDVRRKRKVTT